MKLKSFGCSFIFGNELSDLSDELVTSFPMGQFSRLTWPALVAQKMGYNYECYARPGSGNLQIAERVLNESCASDSDFFIIGWTFTDRFDYYNRPDDIWQPWQTLCPSDDQKNTEIYFKNFHSEYRDKLTNLIYVKTVVDTLLEKNIPFIMTYMDDLMFDQRWHVTPAVTDLQLFLKPYMTKFDQKNFLLWSQELGYAVSQHWHPLEEAHCMAADYIIKNYISILRKNS